jgi:dTDP-4-dehydrorhamnose reductase
MSEPKKILLLGSNGQLGRSFKEELANNNFDYRCFAKAELDILDYDSIHSALNKFKPDFVINCIAYTNVTKAEKEKLVAEKINSSCLKNLILGCNLNNAMLVHFSTDYVFDGKKNGLYSEADNTNPLNIYGQTKLKGEKIIEKYANKFIIIRTSWLFSAYKNNFVSTIFNELQSSNNVSIVSDQYGTPTFAGDLAKSTLSILLDKNILQKLGLYHYGGTPLCSWYEFASEINKQMFELNVTTQLNKIKKINSSQYNDSIIRPKNSGLDSFKICSTFNLKQCNWTDSLSKALMILK